jgi:hypothetical protein
LSNSLIAPRDGKAWRPRASLGWSHSFLTPHVPHILPRVGVLKSSQLVLFHCACWRRVKCFSLHRMLSNRAGYKQSTSRTKDDQCYDSFSRRKFSTNVDRMLGVLADKMVERGEIHVICLAYNAKSITIWCLEDAIW